MLWGSGAVIAVSYLAAFVLPHDAPLGLGVFTHGVQEMINLMWWGILVGMLAVGLIDRVPRQFVIGIIGRDQGAKSLVRAVLAGVLLDLSITASLAASLEMGEEVLKHIKPVNRLHKKRVEQAAFAVLKSPDIPSLLIETGYISNPKEASRLNTSSHQEKMARAIFRGVRDYLSSNPPAGSYLAWKKQGGDTRLGTYKIESGDTLSAIAVKHRVSAKALKKINGLQGDIIRTGQVLKIPASE
jgi:N-acetylmuramoyl-L-alanine amidase